MKSVATGNKKRKTTKGLVNFECWCSVCTFKDVTDNFTLVGKDNFTKLALLALEICKNESKET